MIEIVFSDSACGGLKAAQHFGEGDYVGGCSGVFVSKSDGSEPTPEKLEEAKKTAEEQKRAEWEKASPMGGNPQDVFGFNLILSIGDISHDDFVYKRQKTINELWSIYPQNSSDGEFDFTGELFETLNIIRERVAHGESVRIWYSDEPDELCGLYWFMAELQPVEKQVETVYIVKLPKHECGKDSNTVFTHCSWAEILPGDWYNYTKLAEVTTPVFRRHCASLWRDLQIENAPLRIVLNGKLVGVDKNIYDQFIIREIVAEDDEFQEANLIGRVLGKYQLGISDAWIAHRIEKMIEQGKLTVVSTPAKDMPIYHRRLKKNHIL